CARVRLYGSIQTNCLDYW
nr:immunoglobulin heavy chain junction region [Macaca mulatta]MOV38110.1 immunoglobulin heavy chain junction region [Macaca mulatta]MOV38657.1 immunoglobulin heavy chain junction region [Macaca mulatta]MOV39817.1 immunoglobulin heavy chain junction region [Macaca mulatta]MOV40053.1 immunoglobulin heavy chain junction region [Macaca mulatta]